MLIPLGSDSNIKKTKQNTCGQYGPIRYLTIIVSIPAMYLQVEIYESSWMIMYLCCQLLLSSLIFCHFCHFGTVNRSR